MSYITVAVTGASGVEYTLCLLAALVKAKVEIALLISSAGYIVFSEETDLIIPGNPEKAGVYFCELLKASPGQIKVYGREQWMSPLASGSSAPKKMVICPCTTGCLAAIATGMSDNLIERAADVILKEQGKLILCVREMPLSTLHLENMLKLSRMGAVMMPPNPGFYFKPKEISELVEFVVARILDHLDVPHDVSQRWGISGE